MLKNRKNSLDRRSHPIQAIPFTLFPPHGAMQTAAPPVASSVFSTRKRSELPMKRPLVFVSLSLAACAPSAVSSTSNAPATAPSQGAHTSLDAQGSRRTDADAPPMPVAKKVPHATELHGVRLDDDYFWLREKGAPDVVAYLNAENRYADAVMKPTEVLQKALYDEMLGRIKETDTTVPVRRGAWLYYSRTEQGKAHRIYCRKPFASKGAGDESVLVDLNEIAKIEKFVSLGAYSVSDDGNQFAYLLDTTGFRQFSLHVKDLRAGAESPLGIERVDSVAFAADNRTLFYVVEDPTTKRAYRAYRHVLGEDAAKDALVYEEKDERFDLGIERSRSKAFLFLSSHSKTTSEVRVLPAATEKSAFRVLVPREAGHEYFVDHRGDRFFIRTNDKGRNFRLVSAPVAATGKEQWTEVLPHRP
ncbi:S9 family peptidase, partial [bacterium]